MPKNYHSSKYKNDITISYFFFRWKFNRSVFKVSVDFIGKETLGTLMKSVNQRDFRKKSVYLKIDEVKSDIIILFFYFIPDNILYYNSRNYQHLTFIHKQIIPFNKTLNRPARANPPLELPIRITSI